MENGNLKIMIAEVFYEKTLESQRHMVNIAIVKAMQGGNPIVKLPTQLYVQVSEELEQCGWKEFGVTEETDETVSHIYPRVLDDEAEQPVSVTTDKKYIPVSEYYATTLKKQKQDLHVALEKARHYGLSEVKLEYRAYPELINEMQKNGWLHHFYYADSERKEQCSLFFPKCGF